MRFFYVSLICVALFFSGCMDRSRVADFTLLASKNISTLENAQHMGTFEGKDCKTQYPFTPPRMPSQKEALDRAVEAGKGNAMVNAVVYFKPASCVFDDHCWEIKGDVIKTKDSILDRKSSQLEKDPNFIKDIFTSSSGHEYIAYRHKSNIDLDHDKKYYDLIIRVK